MGDLLRSLFLGDAHSCPQGGFGGETRGEESLCSCERYHHCRIGSKRVENTFGRRNLLVSRF